MKNLTKIFMAVVAGMFAFSCVTDTTEDLGVNIEVENGAGVTELTLSMEAARTHLGDKVVNEDGTTLYPLYWSEGDAISVNGQASLALEGVAEESVAATFKFENKLQTPYCIVYPASAAVAVEEGEEEVTPAPVTVYPVTFLATQPYTVGTFAPQAAPMYAYAEATETVELKHLTGVLRLAIKGNGEKVTSIKIASEKGKIAGTFSIDCKTGKLEAGEDATNTIYVTFAEPLVLGEEEAVVYATVPAGSYGTFLITVSTEANGKMTLKHNSDVTPINVGVVKSFKAFTFEANAADEDTADYLIETAEDLVKFAKVAQAFFPRTKAAIAEGVTEIDMTGIEWSPIEGFGEYTFDGNNVPIKGLSAPLFGTTAATIKNVKLTNVSYEVTDLAHSGAIACKLYGGSLENCSASGAININNTTFAPESKTNKYDDICHGGLVGYLSASTATNCTNDIDITVTSFCEASQSIKATVGGVVGGIANESSVSHLVNDGDITYVGTTQKENIYISGVVGKENTVSGLDGFAAISNCTNNGILSTTKESVAGASLLLSGITGVIGVKTSTVVADNLKNTADFTHNGTSVNLTISGVVGYNSKVSFTNCSNSGDFTVADGATTGAVVLAGLAAGVTTSNEVTNCSNTGNFTLGATAAGAATTIGGLIAGSLTTESISDCSNTGKLKLATGATATSVNMAGIVTGAITATTISGCSNTGELTLAEGATTTSINVAGVLAGETKTTTLENCTNSGAISVGKKSENGEAKAIHLGGVCSSKVTADNVTGCTNSAPISVANETVATAIYMAGVIAHEVHTKAMSDCHNYENGDLSIGDDITLTGYVQIGGVAITLTTNEIANPTFENLTNSGSITVGALTNITLDKDGKEMNGTRMCIGGVAYFVYAGDVSKCYNYASGSINVNGVEEWKSRLMIGGAIGYVGASSVAMALGPQVVNIKDCTNYAPINVSPDSELGFWTASISGAIGSEVYADKAQEFTLNAENVRNEGAITVSGRFQKGGVPRVGGILAAVNAPHVNLKSCVNTGAINVVTENTQLPRIGGIVSEDTNKGSLTITSCENSGVITNSGIVTSGVRMGGILASREVDKPTQLINCVNSGKVVLAGEQTATGNAWAIGGILGYTNKTGVTLRTCTNGAVDDATKGEVLLGTGLGTSGVGGIAGYLSNALTEISGCKNYGKIHQTGASGTCQFGGIIGYVTTGDQTLADCENHGLITNTGVAATSVSLGGLVGVYEPAKTLTITGSKNFGSVTLAGEQTVGAKGSVRYMAGGFVGSVLSTTSTINITGCTNGDAKDGTKGAITISGTTPSSNALAGIVAYTLGVTKISECYNYGKVLHCGPSTGWTSTGTSDGTFMGGILGVGYTTAAATEISACENYGTIELGTTAQGNRPEVGGICGRLIANADHKILNCKNHGLVKFSTKNKLGQESSIGGIIGTLSGGKVEGCDNLGTAQVVINASSSSNSNYGGIAGSLNGVANILSCNNYGAVNQTKVGAGTTQIGGIVGYGYTFQTIDKCHNYGTITVAGTGTNKDLSVGGIAGYTRYKLTEGVTATVSDCWNHADITFTGTCNNYYGGGVIGWDKTRESGLCSLTGLVNVGNLTFTVTPGGNYYYGGIVGASNNSFSNSKCYATITADGMSGHVGMLSGKERTDTNKAANCYVGGTLKWGVTEAELDPDTQEPIGGGETLPGVITAENYYNYLYTAAIDKAVAEGDGCTADKVLTEAPVYIPAK